MFRDLSLEVFHAFFGWVFRRGCDLCDGWEEEKVSFEVGGSGVEFLVEEVGD